MQATVRKMSDMEAGGVAMRIVNMLGIIARNQNVAASEAARRRRRLIPALNPV